MVGSTKLKERKVISHVSELPRGAYFYKEKDGLMIYKNRLTDEFYILKPFTFGYEVFVYKGVCKC